MEELLVSSFENTSESEARTIRLPRFIQPIPVLCIVGSVRHRMERVKYLQTNHFMFTPIRLQNDFLERQAVWLARYSGLQTADKGDVVGVEVVGESVGA